MNPNINDIINKLDTRLDNIESNIDKIKDNHLAHMERYLYLTLVGILISASASLTALYLTIL